jgi:hypothetical protein
VSSQVSNLTQSRLDTSKWIVLKNDGTGKTICAEAIANPLDRQLLVVRYAELESMWMGETSKNAAAIFPTAREEQAVLLFGASVITLNPAIRRSVRDAGRQSIVAPSGNQTAWSMCSCKNWKGTPVS